MTDTTTSAKSVLHNGETISFTDQGSGEPAIVFVHGWCCDHTHFRDQIPHFAAAHRVIGLDLPGHGASDKPDRDYTIDSHVDSLAAVIEGLGLDHPLVVGHSMGGIIALNFAYKHPQLTCGIVLVDSTIAPVPDAVRPIVNQALEAMKTPVYKDVAAGFVRMNLFNDKSPAALVEETVAGMTATPHRVLHTEIASVINHPNPSGPVPVPALFLRAATLFTPADQLRETWPGMQVIDFDCAHFVQMERPTQTNAAIAAFVKELA